MNIVVTTAIFAAALAFVLGVLLCIFRKVFHVETDVLISVIRETLPGANCGACGFPGCDGFAAAVAARTAPPDKCTVSDAENTKKRAGLVGGSANVVPQIAIAACQGTKDCALLKGEYTGIKNCRGAKISAGGTKICAWGCMGFGDCAAVCKFGALSIGKDGLPVIDANLCKGCKACAAECPQGIIRILPKETAGSVPYCNNRSTIKASVKKGCKAGCIKCEVCVKNCPQGALSMENGIPKTDYSKCVSCGTCVEKCRQGVMKILKKTA